MPPEWRHFTPGEFRCPHCGVALVRPLLIAVLEVVRHSTGAKPLRIVSGYRCPVHNKAVGGAKDSQHMYGAAADIPPGRVTLDDARAAGARGVGTAGAWVVHLDVRDGAFVHWRY